MSFPVSIPWHRMFPLLCFLFFLFSQLWDFWERGPCHILLPQEMTLLITWTRPGSWNGSKAMHSKPDLTFEKFTILVQGFLRRSQLFSWFGPTINLFFLLQTRTCQFGLPVYQTHEPAFSNRRMKSHRTQPSTNRETTGATDDPRCLRTTFHFVGRGICA